MSAVMQAAAPTMKITKVKEHIGAIVTGIDLSQPVGPETQKKLYEAVVENVVLVMIKRRRSKQLDLPTPPRWGGRRTGAGRKRTTARPSPAAAVSLASTTAAPPSPGEQNMNRVSGSLTISAASISSADIASRRQALGLREPLR